MTQTDPFATNEASESKTKTADPFGQADGSAPAGDPFGNAPRPDSEFLNLNDLKPNGMSSTPGALVLIRVNNSTVEIVPKPVEYGGGTQKRLSADMAALDGAHAGRTGKGMWCFNAAIVSAVERAWGMGIPCILGRFIEVPSKIEKANAEKYKNGQYAVTAEDLPMAYECFKTGVRKDKPNVAVVLAEHTEEDAVKAREFLAAHPEFLR